MLKFTEFLLEEVGEVETADKNLSGKMPTTPSTNDNVIKKPKFNSIDDCKNFVDMVKANRKKQKSENNGDFNSSEYNGVYVTSKTNIYIEAENGYKYNLTFVPSDKSNLPLYHLTSNPVIDVTKSKVYSVPDKYLPNIKNIFTVLNEWKKQLSQVKPEPALTNDSNINDYENFLFEWTGKKNYANQSSVKNPSKPLDLNYFLNLKLSNLRVDKKFQNLKNYGEVLASIDMLIGNKEKNMPAIIPDMTVSQLLKIPKLFKSEEEANALKPLWYLKIKTVVGGEEPEFREVKYKTLIKKGSEMQICKLKTVDVEQPVVITLKVENLEGKNINQQ